MRQRSCEKQLRAADAVRAFGVERGDALGGRREPVRTEHARARLGIADLSGSGIEYAKGTARPEHHRRHDHMLADLTYERVPVLARRRRDRCEEFALTVR
ncbi:hypothetical protein [Nocardia salmonicida]|uniref:hypothetical protein n=1 Tax=Nocardia salmonicida TaxID=53431 RepID=UPI003400B750